MSCTDPSEAVPELPSGLAGAAFSRSWTDHMYAHMEGRFRPGQEHYHGTGGPS